MNDSPATTALPPFQQHARRAHYAALELARIAAILHDDAATSFTRAVHTLGETASALSALIGCQPGCPHDRILFDVEIASAAIPDQAGLSVALTERARSARHAISRAVTEAPMRDVAVLSTLNVQIAYLATVLREGEGRHCVTEIETFLARQPRHVLPPGQPRAVAG